MLKSEPRQKTISDFHWRILQGSGLSKETIDAAGLYSAKAEEVKALLGMDPRSGGIVFPYPGCGDYLRIRLDTPYAGPGYERPAKYLSRPRSGNRLYIPAILPASKDLLVITEGEKKALKACQEGIPCIATSGVWSWKARNEYGEKQDDFDGLLRDFDRLDLASKELVVLVYDSDINQLHPAWSAYGRLAEQLYARGAKQVKIVCLPDLVKDGKTGLDDYLLRRKPQDFFDLIEHTPTWLPCADGAKAFADGRLRAVMERVSQEQSIDAVYSQEALEALTSLYLLAETEYARAKQALVDATKPRKVDLRALNKQVKYLAEVTRKRQNYDPSVMAGPQAPVELPELPVKLRQPRGWQVTEKGVIYESTDGVVVACPVPIILTQRLRHITTGDERIELAYRRDGDWHKVTANRSTVFNRTSLVTLTDKGLPVSSESAKHLVRYLAELEAENLDVLPLVKASDRFGWLGSNTFLPGAAEGIVLDVEDGSAALAEAYHAEGDFEAWKAAVRPVRESPLGRFALAAGFAAPLLRLLGHRVFIVHLWGDSRGGKTAILKAALSVWGDPEDLMANFHATKVGLERLAGFYSDLPLGIDERQVVGDKQGFVESLVYLLGLGKGKARGAKSGGLQRFSSWRTIVLTTGEEPLSSEASHTGIRTRALELYSQRFIDEREAQLLHEALNEHYGHAGPTFIRRIIEARKENPDTFRDDYKALLEEFQGKMPENIGTHLTAVTTVALADYYSSQWVFGESEDDAFQGSIENALGVLQLLESAAEADVVARAWEFIQGWVASNDAKFQEGCQPPRYGFKDEALRRVYVYPHILENALRDEGFSARAVIQGWAERGWIDTIQRKPDNKRRFKIRKILDGKRREFISLKENLGASEPSEPE